MASIQSSGDLFAGALITAPPDRENRFTNLEYQSAFQNLFGCPQEVCRPHVGKSILSSGSRAHPTVDLYGNSVKSATGVTGDGHRTLHDAVTNAISKTLRASEVPHRGGIQGKPRHCKDLWATCAIPGLERQLQYIIPDSVIDGRNISATNAGKGSVLVGRRSLSDTKTIARGGHSSIYANTRQEPGSAVAERQRRGVRDYEKRARDLDAELPDHQPGEEGPFTKILKSYGEEGRVLIPVAGAFAEMSPDAHAIAELCASLQADRYCAHHNVEPAMVKSMFLRRIHRSWGMRVHLGWARLLLDRLHDLVINPAARRSYRDRDREEENEAYDMDAFNNPNRGYRSASAG